MALLCIAAIGIARPSRAGLPLLAEAKDKEIRAILAETLPTAERQLDLYDADVALVYHQIAIEASDDEYAEYHNAVWWVKRGEAEHITSYVRDFAPGVKVAAVKAFLIRPERFDREAALSAEVQQLDKDRIRVQKGDDRTRTTNVVIAFDTARPGDLLGVSIRLDFDQLLLWRPWLVATHEPVARAELRVKNDWALAYNVSGHRFAEGAVQQEVLEEKDGAHQDIRLWVDGVAPVVDEVYAAPDHLQSPGLLVSLRAQRLQFGRHGWVWWYQRHWNQVAVDMAAAERWYLKKSGRAAETAAQLTSDLEPLVASDALYRHVRDELRSIDTAVFSRDDEAPTVDEILDIGAGSAVEKAYLLLAMLRSRDVDAELLWVHDPNEGGFFRDYPNWGQTATPIVSAKPAGRTRLYDLDCAECGPGVVRPRFAGSPALSYRRDSVELDSRLIDDILASGPSRRQNPFALYMRALELEEWSSLFRLPGDPRELVGWTEETLVYGGSGPTLRLRSAGLTSLRRQAMGGDPESVAAAWAGSRFDVEPAGPAASSAAAVADTLDVSIDLDGEAVPAPMGDTWILPARLVFGEPSVGAWPEERVSAFDVARSTECRWECRIPLPEGWSAIRVPADRSCGFELLDYRITYRVLDGALVVQRCLTERAGIVDDPASVALIGKEIDAIREIETAALVIQRKGS